MPSGSGSPLERALLRPRVQRANARVEAGLAGGLAAFLWASYYVFVLALPVGEDGLLIDLPFLFAGLLFLVAYPGRRPGGALGVLRTCATWPGIVRGGIFALVQLDVVLATRWAGAVDASLVTLLADVVATPLLVLAVVHEDAGKVRSKVFWLGVLLASSGAAATILGNGQAVPLSLPALLSLVPLPFLIAVYFVWVNQASKRAPAGEVLGAASLMAFVVGSLGGVLVFGPAWATYSPVTFDQVVIMVVVGLTSFYLGPFAYFWAAGRTTIVLPAVLQALIPVFTLMMIALLALQRFSWVAWIGVPLAFLGSVVAVAEPRWPGRRRPPDPPTEPTPG